MKRISKVVTFMFIIIVILNTNINLHDKCFIQVGLKEVEAATVIKNIEINNYKVSNKSEAYDTVQINVPTGFYTLSGTNFTLSNHLPNVDINSPVYITGTVIFKNCSHTGAYFKISAFGQEYHQHDGTRTFTFNNYQANILYATIGISITAYNKDYKYWEYFRAGTIYNASADVDINISVKYTVLNDKPTLTLMSPTSNSPLQTLYSNVKEVVLI